MSRRRVSPFIALMIIKSKVSEEIVILKFIMILIPLISCCRDTWLAEHVNF